MKTVLLVSLGGCVGAVCRYWIQNKLGGPRFPVGTLTVNLFGSLLLGLLAGTKIGGPLYLLAGTGFMGAFTTFSTLNVDLLRLFSSREHKIGMIYLAVTYAGGLSAVFFGYWLGTIIMK
ncbi:fluoride efflux transporter FluC [Mesobacillus zeae]|uniref:Fluoride-specific ion channel FluC n=1 Tax=Mesobacillus zeae TaxID=1917180 RepID=A0A398B6W4_9BACI|nr:CrcB family protein [Mesobacillus zeae]RID85582.1 CrcB family protein [Mesobacillus zeae]